MIEAKNLTKYFNKTCAVNNISLFLQRGEILGLVGESGSGKSTLGQLLLRLIPPTRGTIFLDGQDITYNNSRSLKARMQMIFQNPFSSFNPRMRIEDILKEPFKIHRRPANIDHLLNLVQLPQSAKKRFPHEFSGGQKQRIGIARALALSPDFIICDEPTSSLDQSIQTEILNLLISLNRDLKLGYLFISHDLRMIRKISNRLAIMKQGSIVECGPTETIFSNPTHPYTQLLLDHLSLNHFSEKKLV